MSNPSKVKGTVSQIEPFGAGVYLVKFQVGSRYTRYQPGQFLHLTLDEFDPTTGYWPESRVFSIASEPRRDVLSIVYSVKGNYTQRMERELTIGKEVWLKLPYGDFVIDDGTLSRGPIVLIAGGTGVSPFWPFLLKSPERTGEVYLFYGVRQKEHLLFAEELTRLGVCPWFHLHLFVEAGSALPEFPSEQGRLSISRILPVVGKKMATANYYLSGPPGMIRAFQKDLEENEIAKENIHKDEWE